MNRVDNFAACTEGAIAWLMLIRNQDLGGWGWVQHVPANQQNTAEVVVAVLTHSLDPTVHKEAVADSTSKQLLHAGLEGTKDWTWVTRALIEVRDRGAYPDREALDRGIAEGLQHIEGLQDSQSGGWPEAPGEPCQVTWTALTLNLLASHLSPAAQASGKRYLEATQRADGGWGLWSLGANQIEARFANEPQRLVQKATSQRFSNPAATAQAILALHRLGGRPAKLSRGVKWLLNNTMDDAGWPLFQQVGMLGGRVYTYRHFSTAWALQAILTVEPGLLFDRRVSDAVCYFLDLQDIATSGWRSNFDSDPLTWATCNALDALGPIRDAMSGQVPATIRLISDWYDTRHLRATVEVGSGDSALVFNGRYALAASLICTLLLIGSVVLLRNEQKWLQITYVAALGIVVGLPWVTYVRTLRESWTSSVVIVYGIIAALWTAMFAVVTYINI